MRSRRFLFVAVVLGLLILAFVLTRSRAPDMTGRPAPGETAPGQESAANRRSSAALPLQLSPAAVRASQDASFSGRVVSRATGAGVDRAEMTFAHGEAAQTVITAQDGAFEFVAREPGAYQLAAVTAVGFLPFAPAWGQSPLVFTARPGSRVSGVVIELDPEKTILGRVIDPDGTSIRNAAVRLFVPASEYMDLVPLPTQYQSDGQGQFHFHAPVGTLIEAQHPAFNPVRERLTEQAWSRAEIELRFTAKSSQAVHLSISGRVVDGDGDGLPGVPVTAHRAGAVPFDEDHDGLTSQSDPDGGFVVRDLDAGKYDLTASWPGLVTARADDVDAGSDGVVLRLLAAGGSIAGRVIADHDGSALPSFAVIISEPAGKIEERPVQTRSFFDAHGRFLVGPLATREYLVRAVALGYAPSPPRAVAVTVGKTEDVEFRLDKGGAVIGTVLDAETGKPIAFARVAVEGQWVGESWPVVGDAAVRTNAEGFFAIAGPTPGPRSVVADADGYNVRIVSGVLVEKDATAGPVEVRLTLTRDGAKKTEFIGIGVELAPQGDVLLIGKVMAGGGASEAGLVPGDRILAIDGRPVGDLDFDGVVQLMRGPEGSSLVLTVRRANGQEQTVVVVRRLIRG